MLLYSVFTTICTTIFERDYSVCIVFIQPIDFISYIHSISILLIVLTTANTTDRPISTDYNTITKAQL